MTEAGTMNVFQRCPCTSELEPLYLPQQLYLRPIAKLGISLQLPNLKKLGKSVSHWEIMDKLKELIQPDEFTVLKVSKTTVEFVRLEAEVEKRAKLERVISKLNNKMIKLKDFSDLMRVKAAEWRSEFPNRRIWDAYFSEAKDMDEMKAGERPDTMHISNVPSKWFASSHLRNEDDVTPSEKVFYKVFEKFGNIRYVDIPICDPYRKKMKDHISGLKFSCFEKMDWFEGYVQFKDYMGFTKAMDSFRDKKLVHKTDDGYMEVEIKVDFDKTKHLSDASIRRREIVRDRLVKKAKEKEEQDRQALDEKRRLEEAEKTKEENLKTQKEIRRHVREEKRKAKIMKKLEITGSDEINAKIASEKKKLVKVQRKLEAIRLVEELFKRVKEKHSEDVQRYDVPDKRADELRRLKNIRELNYLDQKEKLHNAVKGRAVLKSLIAKKIKPATFSDSSSSSELSLDEPTADRSNSAMHGQHPADRMYDVPPLYGFPYQAMYPPPFGPQIYPDIDIYAVYKGRGRGRGRGRGYGRGRGGSNSRGSYHVPGAFDEYSKYYNPNSRPRHFHDRRRSRSYSPRRSRSRSYSRRRSRSRSRKRSNRRRDYSSSSRSKSRSYDRRSRSKSRRRSRSKTRSGSKNKRRSSREKSRSRERSVDSSKFMTPRQLQEQKEQAKRRSKSWSMPKDQDKRKSWSKSPEKAINNSV